MTRTPICWTIAGSDSGGGAGIQADMAAMRAFGVHPCSVVSALTAQNSVTVSQVEVTPLGMFAAQLTALLEDLPPQAIKTGMLPDAEQAAHFAQVYQQHLADVPLIVDPVAVSASGSTLADNRALSATMQHLVPLATLVTPNIAELELLCGHPIDNDETLQAGAEYLLKQGAKAVLVKGGHAHWQGDNSLDHFYSRDLVFRLQQPRLQTPHTHGTGCSMASAIAAAMALGDPAEDAVVQANAYIAAGLADAAAIGKGPGPVAHTLLPTPATYFPALCPRSPMPGLSIPPAVADFASVGTDALGLYPVVDNTVLLQSLLSLGVKTLQLRIKAGKAMQVEGAIAEAVLLGRQYEARIFINDHWALAIKHKAYGIHLGQEDLQKADLVAIQKAGLRLGVSTHGYFELLNAKRLRPSYIALGHVFATPTKVMKSLPQGLERLRHYTDIAGDMPTVAIGGINLHNAAAVRDCGVGSIAVVRAVSQCEDLGKVVEAFTDVIGP